MLGLRLEFRVCGFRVSVGLLTKTAILLNRVHICDLSLWVGDMLVAYKLAGLTLCVCVCMYVYVAPNFYMISN